MKSRVLDGWMGWLPALVVPVPSAGEGGGIRADGEPGLSDVAKLEVVGGSRAAHASGYPAGIYSVGDHVVVAPMNEMA